MQLWQLVVASKPNALNLLQRDGISRPVVELCGPRGFVRGDVGRRFQGAAILQVNGDPGGAKAVVGNAALDAGRFGAALDDTEGVHTAHALSGELVGAAASGSEEGSFGVLLQAGRCDVGVEVLLGLVMAGDFMELAAFFVEPQPAAFALGIVVLDQHPDRRGHAREAVEHGGDERAVAQAHQRISRNGIQELPSFFGREHGRFALLDDVLGAAHGRGRIEVDDLADHQPVKKHADGGQVLLHGRVGEPDGEPLDVGGHVHRADVVQREATLLAPVKKPRDGAKIGLPSVLVPDLGGEKFEEAFLGAWPLGDDEGGPTVVGVTGHLKVHHLRSLQSAPHWRWGRNSLKVEDWQGGRRELWAAGCS